MAKLQKYWSKIALGIIVLLAFFMLFFSAQKNSQTTDEGVHLHAGYSYLIKNDFRLDPEHPPFFKELTALPLLFMPNIHSNFGTVWDRAGNFYYDSWKEARTLGEEFLFTINRPENILLASRLVPIILTLILGIFAYFWAKKLYGEKAGILAAFFTLFFPNILAHGQLVNTDIAITFFLIIGVYFWGEYLKTKKTVLLLLAGLFTGLTLASKFTGLILVPIIFVLGGCSLWLRNQKPWKTFGAFIILVLIALFVVWGTYGFSLKTLPQPDFNKVKVLTVTPTIQKGYEILRPITFPNYFYKGSAMVLNHAGTGHGSYLLGQTSSKGWWYYFPLTILFKTPVATFIIGIWLIWLLLKRKEKQTFDSTILLLPPAAFLLVAMASKANLGIRHILPIFPFFFIYISQIAEKISWKPFGWKPALLSALLIWYFISAIISFPNYLAYFNELAGGSYNGHKILTDSNLDWGQDLYRIKDFLKDKNYSNLYLVYPWDGQPSLEYYGLNYPELSPDNHISSGTVIISATYYETDAYAWLKEYPAEQITPGVFLVEVR